MATDPVGALFPDLVEEQYVRAPELRQLAGEVIAAFDEFEPIQTGVREAGLRIEYVWDTRPFDPAKDEYGPHAIARVRKVPTLFHCLYADHLVIEFRRWFWERFDDAQRRAVIHHELTHVEVDEPDEQGRIPIKLRKHDVEDFTATMRRFGPVIPGRREFVKAAMDWQHEQDRPEPTPLRPVIEEGRAVDPETGEILDGEA